MKKTVVILLIVLSALLICGLGACTEQGETYKTENDIIYTTAGRLCDDGKSLYCREELVLKFEKKQFCEFNRLTLTYSSDHPIRVAVKYRVGIINKKDDFYLSAGDNISFSGLISGYLKKKKAKELHSIKVSSCTGEETKFLLRSLSAQEIPVLDSDTYFLENARIKVGIRLGWGGGINYIEDKTCPVPELKNLINSYDTGRLVQQSYYGTTGNAQYKPGFYNGVTWSYNPVQGGDKHGNPSRLIDVAVESDRVYVKAQPQDWSKRNALTKSYMENTYILRDDAIEVKNVFTDYSGWEHRYAQQELPAFYTVSYLDSFVWYDGNDPWTGDTLSRRADLNFWGDVNYADDCLFYIKENNSETWCAWVSAESGYGIGLYVPNVDSFFAGRFSHNGSKKPSDVATNYVAPLNTLKIVSYEPIEYGYLITTGTTKQIRKTFTDNKDFTDNSSLRKNYQSMRTEE